MVSLVSHMKLSINSINFLYETGDNLALNSPPSINDPLKFPNSPVQEDFQFPWVTEAEVQKVIHNLKD